jgi:adenosine deaminase
VTNGDTNRLILDQDDMSDLLKEDGTASASGRRGAARLHPRAGGRKAGPPASFDERGAYAYRDFWHFLKVYEAATSVLTTPRGLCAACCWRGAGGMRRHGVIYAELFVSPDFCGGGDLAAWRDYLAAMEEAARPRRWASTAAPS